MSVTYDCANPGSRDRGITRANTALQAGELVVLPTDTVYGVGCDAFAPDAVRLLLAAKEQTSASPPPVLIGHARTLDGLATDVSAPIRSLVEAFWPGPLTVICRAQPSLDWDLGDSRGTVALRMPLHPVALELLDSVGPMAVSSANLVGGPPALTSHDALLALGDAVTVYLDAGSCPGGPLSTIVDGTGPVPRIVRAGVLGVEQLREVFPELTEDLDPVGDV